MADPSKSILAGKFGAPVGVRGEIRLVSYTADPFAIAQYASLALGDGRAMKIKALRPQGKGLVAKVGGIDDRDTAAKLVNCELFIARSDLPQTIDADEFYLADLVGLEVRDGAGGKIGRVAAVHDFGAGDILEIKPSAGASFMVPFTRAAIPQVDIANGCLTYVPLPEVSERDNETQAGRDG